MKKQVFSYDRLIALIVMIGLVSIYAIWKYYDNKNDHVRTELLHLNQNL